MVPTSPSVVVVLNDTIFALIVAGRSQSKRHSPDALHTVRCNKCHWPFAFMEVGTVVTYEVTES